MFFNSVPILCYIACEQSGKDYGLLCTSLHLYYTQMTFKLIYQEELEEKLAAEAERQAEKEKQLQVTNIDTDRMDGQIVWTDNEGQAEAQR